MRAAILTPVYLSFSWVLTVSYQFFTNTAVQTVSSTLARPWPAAASWLTSNLQMVSFVYAFSWIFLLTSILPSLLLGRERSVIVQYVVSMTLTVLALSASSLPWIQNHVQSVMGLSAVLQDVLPAATYLLLPFVLMVYLDVRAHRKRVRSSEDHLFIESGGKTYEL